MRQTSRYARRCTWSLYDARSYIRLLRPVRGPNVKGFAPDQQIKRQVHLPPDDCSNNIVGVGSDPPAIREVATGIFIWPALACMTPSSETWEITITFRMTELLEHLAIG